MLGNTPPFAGWLVAGWMEIEELQSVGEDKVLAQEEGG